MANAETKLEIKFENDLKQLLLTQLKNGGYLFNTKADVEEIVRQYFNIVFREISNQPRTVHVSTKIKSNPPTGSLKVAFDQIVATAIAGGRLNPYLSMELLKPDYKDPLLYDWRIHHLHLGTTTDKGDPRFISRTDELLYVRVEPPDFYCIAILDHDLVDGFANKELIQVIHDDWSHLLASYRFSNIPQPSGNLTNETIHKVRQAGATTFISVSDGTAYMPSGGGYASDGSSISVTRSADLLLGRLYNLEEAIKSDESKVRAQIQEKVGRCPRTIKIKLQSWDETGVLAFEQKTRTHLKIPWVG